ncbi:MAG: PAS domain-containing protein [Alphaproteobacteria bacterium]
MRSFLGRNLSGSRAIPWCGVAAALAAVLAAIGLAVPALGTLGWIGVASAAAAAAISFFARRRPAGGAEAAYLADVLAGGEVGWYVAGTGRREPYVNAAFRRLLELDDAAAAPDPASLLAGAHARPSGEVVVDVPLRSGAARRLAFRAEAGAANEPSDLRIWSVRDAADEPDIFDRRLATYLVSTLDAAPVGLFAADAEGRFTFANETLGKLLGVPRRSLLGGGAAFADFVARTDAGSARGELSGESESLVFDRPVELRRGDGGTTAASLSLCAVGPGGDGPVIGLVREVGASEAGKSFEAVERLRALFENAPIGIALLDRDGVVVECNAAVAQLLTPEGGSPVGSRLSDLLDEPDRNEVSAALAAILIGERRRMPLEVRPKHRGDAVAAVFASRIEERDGAVQGLMLHMIDTTEQKNLELQFAQAQKMQAIGQLAGGIAHDFNNLLTAIIGFCDLLLMRHQAGDHSFADIMQIKQNASRAANLVRQLLAFSRQQTLKPTVLSVTDVLAELSNLIRRLIGESIELKVVHGRDVGFIKADQGQLEQVIVNLAVNARDAMPEGGVLTVRTRNVSRTESVTMGHELLPAGEYVLLEVSDTGVGIPKEHLGKIFEPFFTTKGVGAGTGLGLSTVYGIIKQFGGYIFCDSQVQSGTAFSIFLPRHHDVRPEVALPSAAGERANDSVDLTGRGTILLVEDEAPVRMFGARALRNKGYTVLEADSGEAALEVINAARQTIDLLITDVVMPRMDGPTLTKQVRSRLPTLKVIYISGYAEDAFRSSIGADINFLPKPFSLRQLATKVKEVMTDTAA